MTSHPPSNGGMGGVRGEVLARGVVGKLLPWILRTWAGDKGTCVELVGYFLYLCGVACDEAVREEADFTVVMVWWVTLGRGPQTQSSHCVCVGVCVGICPAFVLAGGWVVGL